MPKIAEIKDEDIFIESTSLTNLIKGKRLRKMLYDNNIKVEIERGSRPIHLGLGFGFNKDLIRFVFHRPKTLDKDTMNEIVHSVGEVIWRKYDTTQTFEYVDC